MQLKSTGTKDSYFYKSTIETVPYFIILLLQLEKHIHKSLQKNSEIKAYLGGRGEIKRVREREPGFNCTWLTSWMCKYVLRKLIKFIF